MLVFNELRNSVHRSGAIQRNRRDYIFETSRFKLFKELFKARGFELKHRVGISARQQFVNLGVVVSAFLEIYRYAVIFLNVFNAILNIGKVAKSQKVHFKKTEML